MTITDYESFMTGVITGLKLGRTTPGRQPPVPSGRYILTESGKKVLTELSIPWGNIAVFALGEWYQLEEPIEYNGVVYTEVRQVRTVYDRDGNILATDGKFAYGHVTDHNYRLTSLRDPGGAIVYWEGMAGVPYEWSLSTDLRNPITGDEYIGWSSGWSVFPPNSHYPLGVTYYEAGDIKYVVTEGIDLTEQASSDSFVGSWLRRESRLWLYYPAGITSIFDGTIDDLNSIFMNRTNHPMITEGG